MRKNIVKYWGQFVGIQGIIRGQQPVFYTKTGLSAFLGLSITPGFPRVSRNFSQTLSPAFFLKFNLFGVGFYPLSTPLNNNNFSKYLT